MPDVDSTKKEKNFYTDIPMKTPGFFLKGSNGYDWA